jgi:hypothetical protein
LFQLFIPRSNSPRAADDPDEVVAADAPLFAGRGGVADLRSVPGEAFATRVASSGTAFDGDGARGVSVRVVLGVAESVGDRTGDSTFVSRGALDASDAGGVGFLAVRVVPSIAGGVRPAPAAAPDTPPSGVEVAGGALSVGRTGAGAAEAREAADPRAAGG